MPRIKRIEPVTLISKEYAGPIEDIPFKEYTADLKKWAKNKKAKAFGKPVLFYYHPFDEMDEKKFRIDVAKPIKILRKGGNGYKVRYLPNMKVAAVNFEGSPSDYSKVYEELLAWVERKNYEPYGNRMENIKKRKKDKNGKITIKSQIQIPVQKNKKR